MGTIDTIKEALSGLTWTEICKVSDETGVPPHTIRRIVSGQTLDPRIQSVEPLRLYVQNLRSVQSTTP